MELLKTKFHIPAFNGATLVSRKRIGREINTDCSLVIVTAPAGFGKTTWLSEWAAACDSAPAWVSLEKSEDSPAVFWSYVITALGSATGGCGRKALEQIRSSGSSPIQTILVGLINDIAEHDSPVTLILDDYHLITDRLIHAGMEFFMDHLPPGLRLVIAGRETPRLGLSKFRISGKLVEIQAPDLRFREAEADILLNAAHDLDLPKADVQALRDKTEGWAAGLMLAILSLREQKNQRAFIDDFTGSHRLVLDYLMDEVLAGLDGDLRAYMLSVSVLERFCPSLCQAVAGQADGDGRMREMTARNVFLIPLDDRGQWFRFHHLFRDCLMKTLAAERGGDLRDLHGNAFVWFRDHGFETEAFNHGILAERFEDAARLLARNAPGLFSESGGYMLGQWIGRLPQRIVCNDPDLCSYHVMLNVMAGSFDSAALLFQEHFNGNSTVAGFKSLIRSYCYFYRDGAFEKCIDEIPRMLDVLPENHVTAREMGNLLLCLSLRYRGDIGTAYQLLLRDAWDEDLSVMKAISYADILIGMGRLDSALTFIDKSIAYGKGRFGENLLSEYGYLYIQKGSILREKNQINEALNACRQGLYLSRNNEYIECVFIGNMEYARVLAAAHDFAEATKAINRSMAAARSSATWGANLTAAYKIRIEIAKGNIARAEALTRELGDFKAREIPFYTSNEALSFCRLCLCKKETQAVHDITGSMIRDDDGTERKARLLECYVLKALACQMDQREDEALGFLQIAFDLTEGDGHIRIFLDEGEPMMTLLRKAVKRNCLPDRLKPYLDDQAGEVKARTVVVHDFTEHFNEREIDILHLMKQGLSNRMIADTLFLSVHTVRWYASRIFAKLDVKRRGEAVAHAEKHGLI